MSFQFLGLLYNHDDEAFPPRQAESSQGQTDKWERGISSHPPPGQGPLTRELLHMSSAPTEPQA